MLDKEHTKVTTEITPTRKEPNLAAQLDDRYVVLDRGDYNRIRSNQFSFSVLTLCGAVSVVAVAITMIINAMKPVPILTQEKPVVIEKPVVYTCGLFGCQRQ